MNRAIKWILIIGGGLTVLFILALVIIPMFVDIQSYKPRIEKRITDATGRTVSLAEILNSHFFPGPGSIFPTCTWATPPVFRKRISWLSLILMSK